MTAFIHTEPTLMVIPWDDPVVDAVGHDARSAYGEFFWLNILGPTALWTLRRLVHGFDRYPLGYELDMTETANALGLSYSSGTSNTLVKALQRCVMFGVSQPFSHGLAVRRHLPPVAARHLARMPPALQALHEQWVVKEVHLADLERARLLADAMVRAGDHLDDVERQLLALGVPPTAVNAVSAGLTSRTATPDR